MAEQNIEGAEQSSGSQVGVGQSSGSQDGIGSMLDGFNPADIKVLAIDANVVCLEILVACLKRCQYQVTSTLVSSEALKILRENKQDYHLVITDVQRPDMDGFELLRIISLEIDIPVIMVSADENKGSILKAIKNGARDYLIKPVRLQEIRNIWQHVIRKRQLECSDRSAVTRDVPDTMTVPPPKLVTKHELPQSKRPRMQWTDELNSKFLDALQKLQAQNEKSHPKKILEIMNVEELTRQNIASHLQKHRNTLKKRNGETGEQKDKPTQTASAGVNQVSCDRRKWKSTREPSRYGQYQPTLPRQSPNNVGPSPGIDWHTTTNHLLSSSGSFPSDIPLTNSGFFPCMGPFPAHNFVKHYDGFGSALVDNQPTNYYSLPNDVPRPVQNSYSGQNMSAWSTPGVVSHYPVPLQDQDNHTKPLADDDIIEMLNELYTDGPLRL